MFTTSTCSKYQSYFITVYFRKLSTMLRLIRKSTQIRIRSLTKDANLFLNEEQNMLRETLRNFADTELKPFASTWDQKHEYPADAIKKMGDLGIMGLMCPEELGGAGMDYLSYAIAMEEISRGCASCGTLLSARNSLWMAPVLNHGSQEQKQKFIPETLTGDNLGCFMLSEPGNGSDAGAASTTAKKDSNGDYIVNGTKNWISGAVKSRYGVLFATSDKTKKHGGISAFIVDMKAPGISFGALEKKMGIKASPTTSVIFEDVVIPKENLLGHEGEGFKIAMKTLDAGRIGIAGQAVGIAQAAFECAIEYSSQRSAFGKPINKMQTIQSKLADMSVGIDAGRMLTWRSALLKDQGHTYGKEAAQAKLFTSEIATNVAHQAIQVLGGMGFVEDMPAERHYRDARICEIYEGTSEIQKLVIAGHLTKEYN